MPGLMFMVKGKEGRNAKMLKIMKKGTKAKTMGRDNILCSFRRDMLLYMY
jgi:hypothetical protein